MVMIGRLYKRFRYYDWDACLDVKMIQAPLVSMLRNSRLCLSSCSIFDPRMKEQPSLNIIHRKSDSHLVMCKRAEQSGRNAVAP